MKKKRRDNIDNYVVKNVYKEVIIRKMRAGQDTVILRERLEKIHGKKWEKIILESVKAL
tara:strand:+ start:192 stop:368 length:177 start_codon:yes stop_codon:yes gene_type:complete